MKIEFQGRALSAILPMQSPDGYPPMWLFACLAQEGFMNSSLENVDKLVAEGYVQGGKDISSAVLETQLYDTTRLFSPENTVQTWYKPGKRELLPVVLMCSVPQHVDIPTAKPGDTKPPAIPMLNYLPLPQHGEYAYVGIGDDLYPYHVAMLPARARQRWETFGNALRELSSPALWPPFTEQHAIASNPTAYQLKVNELVTRERLTTGIHNAEAQAALAQLEAARLHIQDLQNALNKPNRLQQWHEVQRMAQELAADYWQYHQALHPKKTRQQRLPELTSTHKTMLPSSNGFRGLVESFGPGLQPSLWNAVASSEMQLATPNQTLLKVRGDGEHEHKALQRYIMEEMGVEGLRQLVALLATYYEQTGGRERKADARIPLRQMLEQLGYGSHADEKEHQRKLMHTILYLSRTWIESHEKQYEQGTRRTRGGKQVRSVYYTPLFVLEGLKLDEIDGIKIPDAVDIHLGAEFYDLMFGENQHFFILPTPQLLAYHGRRQQQEVCLAFYLSDLLLLNGGKYGILFPNLLTQSGIRLAEDIKSGHDRLRDALRVLMAIEQLEKDGWHTRTAHSDIDTALAVELITGECQPTDLAKRTCQRIRTSYDYLRAAAQLELRRKRREALQRLLDGFSERIQFSAGHLLKAQAEKREAQRQQAIEKSDAAQAARVAKFAKRGRKK